ncbi:MAG TPA: hypothetical protein PKM50_09135 [Methanoregula sp.]|nr:hypothetical protein [Methanoregula sp.]
MYTREASALDLFTDSIRIMGDATLCGVMEFDRHLNPAALEKAIHACRLANPILHSRLVRGRGPAYWELTDPGNVPQIPVEVCNGDYHPHVIGPVDPYGPVQCRARILRRSSGDIIVINLAHAAADAYGLQALMSQLLQEYTNPGSILPVTGGIPERDTLWIRKLLREKKPALTDLTVINPMWPDPFGTSDGPMSFHKDCISPQMLAAIRTHAKDLGGSVNDAILSAYFLAISDITGHNGPIPLFFPVNLRQHLNDGSRVMTNQATNACFTLVRKPGEGMKEIFPRVIHETRALKAGCIGVPEQVGMDEACDPEGKNIRLMAEKMAALQNDGFADIFISNPGTLTLPETEGLTDAYVCYPGGYMPTTCFITSTFKGHMTITMGYQDRTKAREGTKKALALFVNYFESLADGKK